MCPFASWSPFHFLPASRKRPICPPDCVNSLHERRSARQASRLDSFSKGCSSQLYNLLPQRADLAALFNMLQCFQKGAVAASKSGSKYALLTTQAGIGWRAGMTQSTRVPSSCYQTQHKFGSTGWPHTPLLQYTMNRHWPLGFGSEEAWQLMDARRAVPRRTSKHIHRAAHTHSADEKRLDGVRCSLLCRLVPWILPTTVTHPAT